VLERKLGYTIAFSDEDAFGCREYPFDVLSVSNFKRALNIITGPNVLD
jgi:hypothetical protein